MAGRLHSCSGIPIVIVWMLVGVATNAGAQTGPQTSIEPDNRGAAERVSGTFDLLEGIASDGRADPLFGALDGRERVGVVVRYRCRPTSVVGAVEANPPQHRLPAVRSETRIRTLPLSWDALERMRSDPCVVRAEPARLPGSLRSLEVTARTVGATATHRRPSTGSTGAGQTIAILDSPVDILHPAFFRVDGGRFDWIDVDGDGTLTVGRDAVDLDDDGEADADETLRRLAVERGFPGGEESSFAPRQDWLYADENGDGVRNAGPDAGFTELDPGYAEATFVADDLDRDGTIEPREPLYRLRTSKIRRLVRGDETYIRGENLIEAAADLQKPDRHGTAVAGILVGGAVGFHARVGIAPRAELLVYGSERQFEPGMSDDESRHLEALRDAAEQGADVFLSEWTNPFFRPLDGSTNLERAIREARSDGVVPVVPTGNLNRAQKHIETPLARDTTSRLEFDVPNRVSVGESTPRVRTVFGSLQWQSSPDLEIRIAPPEGPKRLLDPAEGPLDFSNFLVRSARSTTPRGTHVVVFYIRGADSGGKPAPLPAGRWTFAAAGADGPGTLYGRVSDAFSGWNPGVTWENPTADHATLSFPSTADAAISVAAYAGRSAAATPDTETGDLRAFSGRGPRIGGGRSVDIAAPDNGFVPLAAKSFGPTSSRTAWYHQFGGTSSSSPHVAGAAALMRARNPDASVDEIESRLLESADTESLQPEPESTPGPAWGHGRLQVHRALYGRAAPAENRRPDAALQISLDSESVRFDASESSDPDGDDLRYRFDFDHDGRMDTSWREGPEISRSRDSIDAMPPVVGSVEVRDPKGANSGAVAVARPGAGDALMGLDSSDAGDRTDSHGSDGPIGTCHTVPSDTTPTPGLGLLVLASLLVYRARRDSARPTGSFPSGGAKRHSHMDLKYKIVRRLLRDDEVAFSRNKNFDAYEDPAVQQALRIYHHLESVESDLLELAPGGDVLLETVDRESADRLAVKLTFADSDAERVSFLQPDEWRLLLENDRVAAILRDLVEDTDAETRQALERLLDDIP